MALLDSDDKMDFGIAWQHDSSGIGLSTVVHGGDDVDLVGSDVSICVAASSQERIPAICALINDDIDFGMGGVGVWVAITADPIDIIIFTGKPQYIGAFLSLAQERNQEQG